MTPSWLKNDFHLFFCRLELLEDSRDNDGLLLLLLHTTDVLASCCEGTNPFIESICQTIFSVEELLEVCWGVSGSGCGVGSRGVDGGVSISEVGG